MFDLAAMEASLVGSAFAGKLHFTKLTGSTNTDATEAARAGAPHGSVYFADEQRSGRGRGDNTWHSASGEGLYVSILLRPALPAARLPFLPLSAGLAAAAAIRTTTGLNVDLRWPNDLLIGERKAGGILVESKTEGAAAAFIVVGIGINVHQCEFDAGLATPATSLDMETNRRNSRQSLLVALLKSLENETSRLQEPTAVAAVPERLRHASTWIFGRRVDVHGPQACTGITAGLDAHGFLLVQTDKGVVTVQTGGIRAAQIG